MEFAAHTFGFVWEGSAEEAFERIADQGFRYVQLMAAPPHFDPWTKDDARTEALRGTLQRSGMQLLAIDLASSDVNLASSSADVVAFAVDAYLRTIERCVELGARYVCVGSGRRHGLLATTNERPMDAFRPAFARVVDAARQQGIEVILENHPHGLLADAAAIDGFLHSEGYKQMRVIYDVANGFAIGEDPVEGLTVLRDRLGVVHMSDSPFGQWRHDPVGSGDIDFENIGRCLNEIRYAGPVALEILCNNALSGLIDGRAKLQIFADNLFRSEGTKIIPE